MQGTQTHTSKRVCVCSAPWRVQHITTTLRELDSESDSDSNSKLWWIDGKLQMNRFQEVDSILQFLFLDYNAKRTGA